MLCAHFHFSYSAFLLLLRLSHSLSPCLAFGVLVASVSVLRFLLLHLLTANVFLVGAVWLQLLFTSSHFCSSHMFKGNVFRFFDTFVRIDVNGMFRREVW